MERENRDREMRARGGQDTGNGQHLKSLALLKQVEVPEADDRRDGPLFL